MEIPNIINQVLMKEGYTYKELKQKIKDSMFETDLDTWEIRIDMLAFPVKLTNREMFEFFKVFFYYEYDEAVLINICTADQTINVERDKRSGCLVLFAILLISSILLGVIITRCIKG